MPKMCFTADADTIDKVKCYCRSAGITYADFLRELIKAFLGDRTPVFPIKVRSVDSPSGSILRF